MAVIVETGSVVADANSFIDLVYLRTFAEDRGLAPAGLDDDDIASAKVVLAGQYLQDEQTYVFRGTRVSYLQTMPYPRTGASESRGPAIPDTVVPWRCKVAQALLTLKALAGETLQPGLANGGLAVQSRSIGPLSTTYMAPSGGAAPSARKRYPDVDGVLFPLLMDRSLPNADPTIFQTAWEDTAWADAAYDYP